MKTLSISQSAINLYNRSQLGYYLQYIENRTPDNLVVTTHADAGTALHATMEELANDKSKNPFEVFDKYWAQYKLDTVLGFNNKPLDKSKYLVGINYGLSWLNKVNVVKTEQKIKFLFVTGKNFEFFLSGAIDLQATLNNELVAIDWKTSSAVDESGAFTLQAKMYCYLIWKKFGQIPAKFIFVYNNLKQTKEYSFTEAELKEYEEFLYDLCNELDKKGYDINLYDIGEDSIFNQYKESFQIEKIKRDKNGDTKIIATISHNQIEIVSKLPLVVDKYLSQAFSYKVSGAEFSDLYKRKIWDGKKYKYKNQTFPLAYKEKFEDIISQYNRHYMKDYSIEFIDKRDTTIMQQKFNTKFKPADKELRYYQKDAVEKALKHKMGILYLGTSAGKTFIAGEIIKRLDKRSLFLVNKLELAKQTHKEFEEYLGVPVGLMTEGNMVIDNQVTVATIQTIYTVLNNGTKDEKKLLFKYLYNTPVLVYDECLIGTTKILCEHGAKKISEIVNKKLDIKVLSYNFNTNTYEYKKVLNYYKTPQKKIVKKIKLINKKTGQIKYISCSDNHKLYIKNKGYTMCSDIKIGDVLYGCDTIPCPICQKQFPRRHLGGHYNVVHQNPNTNRPKWINEKIGKTIKYKVKNKLMKNSFLQVGNGRGMSKLEEYVYNNFLDNNWTYNYSVGSGNNGFHTKGWKTYKIDFYNEELNIGIEVNGKGIHKSESAKIVDNRKINRLLVEGYKVITLSEVEIKSIKTKEEFTKWMNGKL